jgi:hypothetical protein
MKHKAPKNQRLKLTLAAVGMAVLGVLLIFLSILTRPETPSPAEATASAPASAPAPGTTPPARNPPIDQKTATARNMSSMLLLFGLMSFTVTGVCVILLILDIRRSRPAWKTQTRYPRRR